MTTAEVDSVTATLTTCEKRVSVVKEMGTAVQLPTQRPESQEQTYGSCEDATSAGEQQAQGSQGRVRGFPKAMVPTARDGPYRKADGQENIETTSP